MPKYQRYTEEYLRLGKPNEDSFTNAILLEPSQCDEVDHQAHLKSELASGIQDSDRQRPKPFDSVSGVFFLPLTLYII